MEWRYKQSTGELFLSGSPVTTPFVVGYAGAGSGRNNPDLQCVEDIGPIPRGGYTIRAETNDAGTITLPLDADPDNDMCGRAGFLIHADNAKRPGWASQGCIVVKEPDKRRAIADSTVKRLLVVR